MKPVHIALAASLLVLADLASAESWEITVVASYLNNKPKLVTNVPVVHFVVPAGGCVDGVSRTEDMIPEPVTVTQRVCVNTLEGGMTEFSGWLFVTDRVTDVAFQEVRGQLNYGQPLKAATDGNRASFGAGMYQISATRLRSSR